MPDSNNTSVRLKDSSYLGCIVTPQMIGILLHSCRSPTINILCMNACVYSRRQVLFILCHNACVCWCIVSWLGSESSHCVYWSNMMCNFQTPLMMAEERRLVVAWISWVEEDHTKHPEVCVCYNTFSIYITSAHLLYVSVIETRLLVYLYPP